MTKQERNYSLQNQSLQRTYYGLMAFVKEHENVCCAGKPLKMCANVVGIDIGTTSVKICLVAEDQRILECVQKVHNAGIKNANAEYHEQDPVVIFDTIKELCYSLKATSLKMVSAISVTGQMHGIVLWNSKMLSQGKICSSPLITWMDHRVPQEFVQNLPRNGATETAQLHVGYGLVTLAWLQKCGQLDKDWDSCGTIMDMFNCFLAKLDCACIGVQNAFSWGYCSLQGEWIVPESVIPKHLLPRIVKTGQIIGAVKRGDFRLPIGTSVFSSTGDLQSTVYPLLTADITAGFVNLGTSAQLGCIQPKHLPLTQFTVPFFNDHYLVAVTSMNGGNTLQFLANKIVEWASSLTGNKELAVNYELFERILHESGDVNQDSGVRVTPTFYSERNDHVASMVEGLSTQTSIHILLRECCVGIIDNLLRMFPLRRLNEFGVQRLFLAGNASRSYYKSIIADRFDGFQLDELSNVLSADFGAALSALNHRCAASN